jgi:hypothetical protein
MTILRPRNQDFADVGWLAAFAMLHGVVWAAGSRSGDVDQRSPKETIVQHGGPVYDVTQPPDGRRAAKGDGVEPIQGRRVWQTDCRPCAGASKYFGPAIASGTAVRPPPINGKGEAVA